MTTAQHTRPVPPRALFEDIRGRIQPAPEVAHWLTEHILKPTGALHNPDHSHLLDAHIGVMWSTIAHSKGGRIVLGQAEVPMFQGGGWKRARQEQQIVDWFGGVPDFLITLDAWYCDTASETEFCALVEHELYHCGHACDEFGVPRFSKDTGLPKFAIRGHDVEEFIGVVRRYGVTSEELADMIIAASRPAEVTRVNMARACGTCLLKAV